MIFIDHRELEEMQDKNVASFVPTSLDIIGLKYEIQQLELCDYIVTGQNGTVAIEHKLPEDYIRSMLTGHLNDQLVRMSHAFKYSLVVIEGSIDKAIAKLDANPNAVYSSIWGTVLKTTDSGEMGNISILQIDNPMDIVTILDLCQKKLVDPQGLIRLPVIQKPQEEDKVVRLLCCVPGVGQKTAEKLREYIPTVTSLFTVELEDFKKLAGQATGEKIYRFFHDEPFV